jgi:hypothetical protein
MADSLEEHARALAAVFDRTAGDESRLRRFVEGFVRPHGLGAAATPRLADAVEELARLPVSSARSWWPRAARFLLYPLAMRMRPDRSRGPLQPSRAGARQEAGGGGAVTPRRFLFVMNYPGYLRYFDSAVRMLAERGHHVDVAFDIVSKQAEGADALVGIDRVDDLGLFPLRGDDWAVVARAVRGTMDYARYLHPSFADTPYLRDRMRSALPWIMSFLGRRRTVGVRWLARLNAICRLCERAIPSSPVIERFIRSRMPDAVLVTPLVTDQSPQVDTIKAAHALGIPAALCVASWDHLTTKGLVRVQPDLVSVWNGAQKAEALEFHDLREDRLVVTGAQPFDRWFERRPTDRAAFCRKVGLPADRPVVLFTGSTASISAPVAELGFVRRWIEALRREPALADVSILIRPHPFNAAHWGEVDLTDLPRVAVYPRSANPVNEADRQDYFDSLFHSEAVVGINTTAMIEAAIVGRTVHSVLAEEFKDTQGGTLHFRYLLSENGGFLRVAADLAEHATQLAETLASPEIGRDACARFVRTFVRPHGIDVPATPILVDALERLASARRAPVRMPAALYPLRLVLWIGAVLAMYPKRLFNRARKQVRITEKKVYNFRKRMRSSSYGRGDRKPGSEQRRRKAG